MYREIRITVYTADKVAVYDEYGDPTELLGYVGEDEATELTISLPTDWTGSFYLDWFYSGAWHEGTPAYTDHEIIYNVPSMPVGDVYMRVRIENGDTTAYTRQIKFVVKS